MSIKSKLVQLLKALENIENEINLATFFERKKVLYCSYFRIKKKCNIFVIDYLLKVQLFTNKKTLSN